MDVEYNMKAAIWARVSTTEQETENQLSNLQSWATAKYLEVVETYSINESAYRGAQRNALEAMYRDAHQGRFQVLLVWSLDRLSREGIRQTLDIFNKLSGHGVQVLSYQEPWTASAGPEIRELMISITGWIANQYSRRLSENTKAGMARAKANGIRLGRPPGAKDKKQRRRRGHFSRYAD